jgi:hypothetical protein
MTIDAGRVDVAQVETDPMPTPENHGFWRELLGRVSLTGTLTIKPRSA